MIGFLVVTRPQTSRDQGGGPGADHVGKRDHDHHDRVRQVDRRQLIIVPHKADEIRVHQVVEDHNEHPRDQRNTEFHHRFRRFLPTEYIYALVFFIRFRCLFHDAALLLFIKISPWDIAMPIILFQGAFSLRFVKFTVFRSNYRKNSY